MIKYIIKWPSFNFHSIFLFMRHIWFICYTSYLISKGRRISKRQLLVMVFMSVFNGPSWRLMNSIINNILGITSHLIINIYIIYRIWKGNANIFRLYLLFLLPRCFCADVYETSICSPNDTLSMYTFLLILHKYTVNPSTLSDEEKDTLKNKYNDKTMSKYKIYKVPEPNDFHCNFDPLQDAEPLSNIAPQINGYIINENWPLKIHKCPLDECEAVYRQVQSSIYYDESVCKEYISYSQRWIDDMVKEYFSSYNFKIALTEYFSKLGSKRKEYIDAWNEYTVGSKIDYTYNMHPKSDEKIVINWAKLKAKSRNISAQKSMCKLLMGMVCECGMAILHNQEWAGPGENYISKSNKFLKWINDIHPNSGVLCCDGSAFDSTQHHTFIQNIDSYFLKLILGNCFYIEKYFDINEVMNILEQHEFKIYSKYFAFKILGTQLSGRMNTCLCNTLRSATYIKFIIHKMEEFYHKKLDFSSIYYEVTGDDQIIFIDRTYKDLYIEFAYKYVYYHEDINICHGLGQVCKIFDYYPDIIGAEYLSCLILYNRERNKLTLMRKPDRFVQLIPFTFRNKHLNIVKYNALKRVLCYEVGLSVTISCKNIPLYRSIGEKMMSLGMPLSYLKDLYKRRIIHTKSYKQMINVINERKKELSFKIFSDDDYSFKEEFEDLMLERYNITPEDIADLIQKYNSLDDINDEVHCEFVDKLYNVTPKEYESTYINIFRNGEYVYRTIENGKYIIHPIIKYKYVVNDHFN